MKNTCCSCPVQCLYCMAQKVSIRADHWNSGERIGINKSCVFINRLPQDPPVSEMGFPFHLMDGEYLGFQGITDCFWSVYHEDLKFVVEKVATTKIKKLVLISKIPVTDLQVDTLLPIKDKLTVCYSCTGLDSYERTTTDSRIDSMCRLRDCGIDVLPVLHPYIHGLSNAVGVFSRLQKEGFLEINWKGFRYSSNMAEFAKMVPKNILEPYVETEEQEILIGNGYLLDLSKKYNLSFVDLKTYLHKGNQQGISLAEAESQVRELINHVVFSTSSSKDEVVEATIKRRL